jgi:hypothetical protein
LAAHAQLVFHLRHARACRFPLQFEFVLTSIQTDFFTAQAF